MSTKNNNMIRRTTNENVYESITEYARVKGMKQ